MTFAEHAFAACARAAKEVGRRLNKDEWLEAVQQAYDSYPHGGLLVSDGKKPKNSRPNANDEDWLKELEANPAYAGIDIRAPDQGAQELHLDIAGQGGQRAHPQGATGPAGFAQRGGQIIGGAKDRLGMIQRDAARLGQNQTAAAAFEKVLAQCRLQRPQLGRQGRLRQVQMPRRTRQGAVAGNGKKQSQMMQVQLGHSSII